MDRTSTVASLTADILEKVAESETSEKVAALALPEFTNPLAKNLYELSLDMRKVAAESPDISYEDLKAFQAKIGGRLT